MTHQIMRPKGVYVRIDDNEELVTIKLPRDFFPTHAIIQNWRNHAEGLGYGLNITGFA